MNAVAGWTMLVGGVANASCAILGCYLVLRRMSLLGDAIGHSILPGIVLAFVFTGSLASPWMFVAAVMTGLLTTMLTQTLASYGSVPEDVSMGVVFTSLFALGVVLLTRLASGADLDTDCVFYGSLDGVPLNLTRVLGYRLPVALPPMLFALATTLVFVGLFWKELKLTAFDPALADAMGLRAALVHYLLMGMVALVTVASFKALGAVLVTAMLIVPAATAHLLTERLGRMMLVAVAVAVISAVVGYLVAVRLDTGVSGVMAAVAGAQFALAVVFAPHHGLVSKTLANFSLNLRIMSEDLLAMLYRAEEPAGQAAAAVTWRRAARSLGGGFSAWLVALWLLRRGGLRLVHGWTLELTDRGRQAAQSLVRAHRLWEAYLGEHFQLPLDHLHEPAERIEHFLGPQLQEQLANELRAPAVDPHGREIPAESGRAAEGERGSGGNATG